MAVVNPGNNETCTRDHWPRNPDCYSCGLITLKEAQATETLRMLASRRVFDNRLPDHRQVGGDHYRNMKITPWDFIVANGLDFFEGNIVKYVTRWRRKGGAEDLKKARHYLDKLIEISEPGVEIERDAPKVECK